MKTLATRRDDYQEQPDGLRVDVDKLSSGVITPIGGGAGYESDPRGGVSGTATPPKSKKEMREHYKTLGGRKSKSKGLLGGVTRGVKDRGGMGDTGEEDRFAAPW